jgi:hypothetical protein
LIAVVLNGASLFLTKSNVMKPFFKIISLLFVLVAMGCCKDKEPNEPDFDFTIYWEGLQEEGSAEATVSGMTWKASAFNFPQADQPPYFSVFLLTYTDEGFNRDAVNFGNFSAKVGEYQVVADTIANNPADNIIHGSYSQNTDDGDVGYGTYDLNTNHENVVFIDKVDTITHEMEGRFSLLFDLKEEDYDKNLAKHVFFENGKFKVKI